MLNLHRTKWMYTLVVAWMFMSATVICSSICQAAESKQAAHSCCPNSSDQSQQSDNKSDQCCDSHGEALLHKSQTSSENILSQPTLVFVSLLLNDLLASQHPKISPNTEGPPVLGSQPPLYIIKSVFLL